MAPGELAFCERACDVREFLEAAAHAAELLQLAPRDAEPLARIVVDPDEAEAEVGATAEKRAREPPDDAPAERP